MRVARLDDGDVAGRNIVPPQARGNGNARRATADDQNFVMPLP